MTEDSLPSDRHAALRVVPMPADTNSVGDIFGGWIMSHVDVAGAIAAARRARGRVVTIAVNALTFKKPVLVGDVVSFYADVVRVGNTSITVTVDVYAERRLEARECVKVTEATLTYVAMDDNRRPRLVPPKETATGV
jgi:acyl-CoA thioesterase YciA